MVRNLKSELWGDDPPFVDSFGCTRIHVDPSTSVSVRTCTSGSSWIRLDSHKLVSLSFDEIRIYILRHYRIELLMWLDKCTAI